MVVTVQSNSSQISNFLEPTKKKIGQLKRQQRAVFSQCEFEDDLECVNDSIVCYFLDTDGYVVFAKEKSSLF